MLLTAHWVGQRSLHTYSHLFSPKKYTQPQLFACLVLKEFLRTDYRKLSALLQDTPDLCVAIGLEKVPNFTTFQKAHDRLLGSRRAKQLLDETVDGAIRLGMMNRKVRLAAIDGTGFESRHVSVYYAKRKRNTSRNQGRKRRRFPKAGFICDCRSHLMLAVVPGRGPRADDKHFKRALQRVSGQVRIETLLADAGYDSESLHVHARGAHGAKTIIPPTRGRPTDKLPKSKWRKRMATHFDHQKYGQRWQIETVISMIKRQLGSALRSRKTRTQNRETHLRAITHNVMHSEKNTFSTEQLLRINTMPAKYDGVAAKIADANFFTTTVESMGEWDRITVCSQRLADGKLTGNSFWLTLISNDWYAGSWGGSIYRIPRTTDVATFCIAWLSKEPDQCCADFDYDIKKSFDLTEVTETAFDDLARNNKGLR